MSSDADERAAQAGRALLAIDVDRVAQRAAEAAPTVDPAGFARIAAGLEVRLAEAVERWFAAEEAGPDELVEDLLEVTRSAMTAGAVLGAVSAIDVLVSDVLETVELAELAELELEAPRNAGPPGP